jgi:ABC-type phosphate transport system substrate-binding protein
MVNSSERRCRESLETLMIGNRRGAFVMLAVLAAAAPGARAQQTASGDVAIVVRPDVPVDNLTFQEVRELLMGDRQFWKPGLRVALLMRAPATRERDVILKVVYRMGESEFRRYWIEKVFRAEAQAGPKIVYSNEAATELVASIPGAVAFVDATQVPKGLKVLRIDGALPGEKGYRLH